MTMGGQPSTPMNLCNEICGGGGNFALVNWTAAYMGKTSALGKQTGVPPTGETSNSQMDGEPFILSDLTSMDG